MGNRSGKTVATLMELYKESMLNKGMASKLYTNNYHNKQWCVKCAMELWKPRHGKQKWVYSEVESRFVFANGSMIDILTCADNEDVVKSLSTLSDTVVLHNSKVMRDPVYTYFLQRHIARPISAFKRLIEVNEVGIVNKEYK
jgi:hypothetical protein